MAWHEICWDCAAIGNCCLVSVDSPGGSPHSTRGKPPRLMKTEFIGMKKVLFIAGILAAPLAFAQGDAGAGAAGGAAGGAGAAGAAGTLATTTVVTTTVITAGVTIGAAASNDSKAPTTTTTTPTTSTN